MHEDRNARGGRAAVDRIGARIDADGGEETRLAGSIALNLRAAIADVAGAEVVGAALDRIPDRARVELAEALPIGWVSLRAIEYLLHATAEVAGTDVLALNEAANRRASERTFTTVWRLILRMTSVEMLFARSSSYFARSYDRGSLDARVLFPGRGQLEIRGRPRMSRLAREGFAAGVETLLRCSGRRGVRAPIEPHPDGADCMVWWHG